MSTPGVATGSRKQVLEREILPAFFPGDAPHTEPTLVLLSGVPGSGSSRATGRLLKDAHGAAVIRAADLRAFGDGSTDATAEWLQGCIRHARQSKHSLVLDGALRTPRVVAATLEVFAAQGFRTRVVLVGARRADALLALASEHVQRARSDRATVALDTSHVDAAIASQHDIAASLESFPSLDRVSVWGGRGDVVYDSDTAAARATGDVPDSLLTVETSRMSTGESVQWLSELRRLSAVANDRRERDQSLTRALIDLHEIALHEVIPALQVNASSPRGAEVLSVQERATAARLIVLRRSLPVESAPDLAAPVISTPGTSTSGPSR